MWYRVCFRGFIPLNQLPSSTSRQKELARNNLRVEVSWTRRDNGQVLTRGGNDISHLDLCRSVFDLPVFKTDSRSRDLDTRSDSLATQQCYQQRDTGSRSSSSQLKLLKRSACFPRK